MMTIQTCIVLLPSSKRAGLDTGYQALRGLVVLASLRDFGPSTQTMLRAFCVSYQRRRFDDGPAEAGPLIYRHYAERVQLAHGYGRTLPI